MKNMPRVSVLMSVFNCSDTVARSIESILNQSFRDFEFIICDDGSTDSTLSIINKYRELDPRIVLIKNSKNCGLAFSLNKCLQTVSGEYCARMDGDDTCETKRFEKQVIFLDRHPQYGFVSTTMKRMNETGIYRVPPMQQPYEPTLRDYIKGSPFCHAPVMIRTDAYHAVGGYRDIPQTRQMEDYDLWFRLRAKGIRGCIIREPLYCMFDGKQAAKRRTYRRRINESWVRWHGYAALHVPFIYRIYVLKPLLIGLIPQKLYQKLR